MKRFAISAFGVLVSVAAATSAWAEHSQPLKAGLTTSAYMRVYGPSQPPYGFVRFCEMRPGACAPQDNNDKRFQPTPERLSELDDVNRGVNRAIAPATDMDIYGVSEYWTLPVDNRGDCEDYALLKQKLLVARGWPLNALLLTVVRDEKDEGHAVLTVRTSQGDYILDNKVDSVKLWNKSNYHFVMRQSYLDPRVWVSLDASEGAAPAAIAGVREGQ